MSSKFAFHVIKGFREIPGRSESLISSGNGQLLQHLVGKGTENDLSLVLEACQKRLNALLEDRNQIGRVLHDCVLLPLFAITSSLTTRRQLCLNLPSDNQCHGDQLIEHLNELTLKIRRVIRGLEEGEVQEFDLMSEMHAMINSYKLIGHLHIEPIIQADALTLLTNEEKHEVLNIAREALGNCVRHAQASRAIIKLSHSSARIRLAIMDNGIGFIPTESQGGFGLPNIKTRVQKLGGRLHVRSQKGRGTRVVAEFSLEPILAPT